MSGADFCVFSGETDQADRVAAAMAAAVPRRVLDVGFSALAALAALAADPNCEVLSVIVSNSFEGAFDRKRTIDEKHPGRHVLAVGTVADAVRAHPGDTFDALVVGESAAIADFAPLCALCVHDALVIFEGVISQPAWRTPNTPAAAAAWNAAAQSMSVVETAQYDYGPGKGHVEGAVNHAMAAAAVNPPKTVIFYGTHPSQTTGYSRIARYVTNSLARTGRYTVWHIGFDAVHGRVDKSKYTEPIDPRVRIVTASLAAEGGETDRFGAHVLDKLNVELEPDFIILYNDSVVLSQAINRLTLRSPKTKIVSYLDIVFNGEPRKLVNHITSNSDKVTMFSKCWERYIIDKHNIAPAKITTFPHPVDQTVGDFPPRGTPEDFKSRNLAREALFSSDKHNDHFIVSNINRNSFRKLHDVAVLGFITFLKAAGYPNNVKFIINTATAGSYSILEMCERMAFSVCGMGHAEDATDCFVTFGAHGGKLSEETRNNIIKASDVGINTCAGEGVGLCQLEGLAAGVFQIATDCGGISDLFSAVEGLGSFAALPVRAVIESPAENSVSVGGLMEIPSHADLAAELLAAYRRWEVNPRENFDESRRAIQAAHDPVKLFNEFEAFITAPSPPAHRAPRFRQEVMGGKFEDQVSVLINVYVGGCEFAVVFEEHEDNCHIRYDLLEGAIARLQSKGAWDAVFFGGARAACVATRAGISKFLRGNMRGDLGPLKTFETCRAGFAAAGAVVLDEAESLKAFALSLEEAQAQTPPTSQC